MAYSERISRAFCANWWAAAISTAAAILVATNCHTAEPTKASAAATTPTIQASKYKILDPLTDLTDRARAKQNVEDTLIKHPDVGCLVGLWSYNGPAILSAVKDANKQGKVTIVCFDEEDDTLQGAADGHILGTIVQQPFEFGYRSVKLLCELGKGDKSGIPADKIVDVPVKIIRKDGAMAFKAQLSDLIKSTSGEMSGKKGGSVRVAFVTNSASDFWKIARAGIHKAESELDVTCEFHIPPNGSADEQQRIVEALIAKKVSGMAISPIDPANQTELLNRAGQAMNVICHDSDAPKSNRLCYVGTNNYKAGREAGKLVKEALPQGGSVRAFVGRLDAQNAKERYQGLLDELSGKP